MNIQKRIYLFGEVRSSISEQMDAAREMAKQIGALQECAGRLSKRSLKRKSLERLADEMAASVRILVGSVAEVTKLAGKLAVNG